MSRCLKVIQKFNKFFFTVSINKREGVNLSALANYENRITKIKSKQFTIE